MVAKGYGRGIVALGLAIGCVIGASPALGDDDEARQGATRRAWSRTPCSATAQALFAACRAEVTDDAFVKRAKCINVVAAAERAACVDELDEERDEATRLCREQRDGRLEACTLLGEVRYDPDVRPALFDDPRNPSHPNPYFPLAVGNRWEYRGGGEINTVEVVDETKLIAGVGCIVVRDLVSKSGDLSGDPSGDLTEATDDWYAHAKDGTTWYFGEEVKNFESFDGDAPRRPELVSIDGSFKAGRERDKPGVIFLALPAPGAAYLEEFSLGNAEDVTVVLSTTYAWGDDPELDQLVPGELAQQLCSGDCVVTKNFSLIEPGIFARKYYARGIGVFLEVEPDEPVVSQLVGCNFDSRCASLPQP
ncbi:MAG TPA: hypothetical protein VKA21_02700 [Candidatus Binatia bacterium]|nr:hypothetical protein [Candidatus Binatia bacterium]